MSFALKSYCKAHFTPETTRNSWITLAPILPITCSLIFLSYKTTRLLNRHARLARYGRPAPLLYAHWDSDFNAQDSKTWSKYIAEACNNIHTLLAMGMVVNNSESYMVSLRSFSSLEAAALVLSIVLQGDYEEPSLLTAVGWVFLSFSEPFDENTSIVLAYLALFLAGLCIRSFSGTVDAHRWLSGTFLTPLALSRSVFAHTGPHTWSLENQSSYIILMCGITELTVVCMHHKAQSSDKRGVDHARRLLHLALRSTFRFLVLLLPMGIGALSTGLLASCLDWQSVLLNSEVRGPKLAAVSFTAGIVLFLFSWTVTVQCEKPSTGRAKEALLLSLRSHACLCTELIGFTCTILSSLWLVLAMMTRGATHHHSH